MVNQLATPTALLALTLLSLPVGAQVPAGVPSAGAIQEQSTRMLDYLEAERKLKEAARKRQAETRAPLVEGAPPAPAGAAPSQATPIPVRRIEVGRSEILSEAEIRRLVQPYEGRQVLIGELFELVEAFNRLYAEKQFPTARALLPAQKIRDGVVRIDLAEGRVGAILIEGNASTRDDFIKDRLALKAGALVNLEALARELAFFNGVNDLSLRAELRPGKEFGSVDTILRAEEPERNQLQASLDNTGRESVGKERIGLSYSNASLFGFRDALTLSGFVAAGTEVQSVAYSVPIGPLGTRLGAGYDASQIRVKRGSFQALDIGGGSTATTLNLKHPFLVTPASKLEGSLSVQEKQSDTTFSGIQIAQVRVRSHALGLNGRHFDEHGVWQTSHTLTRGIELHSDQQFTRYNGEIARLRRLDDDIVATLRGNLQWANRRQLPATEQYQLGGLASVRGYSEGLLSGDQGYFVGAELNFPLRRILGDASSNLFGGQLRGTAFVDHGGAFPFKGNNQGITKDDFLTSAGFGLLLNFSKTLSGRLEIGFPLVERLGEGSPRLHFVLQSQFF